MFIIRREFVTAEITAMSTQAAGTTAMFENYRRYRRYSISAKAVITRRDQKDQVSVLVNNISQGGMGFYTSESFDRSTPVSVELSLGILEGVDRIEGTIASVSLREKDYFTGIAFDTEIPYERFVDIIG